MCALGDGSLFYFSLNPITGALSDTKRVSFEFPICGNVCQIILLKLKMRKQKIQKLSTGDIRNAANSFEIF